MTARLTDEELTELERLSESATAGMWRTGSLGRHDKHYIHSGDSSTVGKVFNNDADATLIVAMRNAIDRLVAEVRAGRKVIEQARFLRQMGLIADDVDTLGARLAVYDLVRRAT